MWTKTKQCLSINQYAPFCHNITESTNAYSNQVCGLHQYSMMTSWNWNIFRVTAPLWVESTGLRWIPLINPMTRSFDVFFDLCLDKRVSKQSRCRRFETPSCPLWRHCNGWAMLDVSYLWLLAVRTVQWERGCQVWDNGDTDWCQPHFSNSTKLY